MSVAHHASVCCAAYKCLLRRMHLSVAQHTSVCCAECIYLLRNRSDPYKYASSSRCPISLRPSLLLDFRTAYCQGLSAAAMDTSRSSADDAPHGDDTSMLDLSTSSDALDTTTASTASLSSMKKTPPAADLLARMDKVRYSFKGLTLFYTISSSLNPPLSIINIYITDESQYS